MGFTKKSWVVIENTESNCFPNRRVTEEVFVFPPLSLYLPLSLCVYLPLSVLSTSLSLCLPLSLSDRVKESGIGCSQETTLNADTETKRYHQSMPLSQLPFEYRGRCFSSHLEFHIGLWVQGYSLKGRKAQRSKRNDKHKERSKTKRCHPVRSLSAKYRSAPKIRPKRSRSHQCRLSY
jgi:hypothetical protein